MSKVEKSLAPSRDFWAEERALMNACERCQTARAAVAAQGFRVSDVPDHGETWCAAQSVEHLGAATFMHPAAYIRVNAPSAAEPLVPLVSPSGAVVAYATPAEVREYGLESLSSPRPPEARP